jgi:hypothetical protein
MGVLVVNGAETGESDAGYSARAFRPQQRLPYDKRKKDMSSLGLSEGQTNISKDLEKEIEEAINNDSSDSEMASRTSLLYTSKTPFDPSWDEVDRAW